MGEHAALQLTHERLLPMLLGSHTRVTGICFLLPMPLRRCSHVASIFPLRGFG